MLDEPGIKDVLVVIPCLNEELYLESLVLQVLACCPRLVNIVIVDGGSTDATRDIAERLASDHSVVKYLFNPQRIQSAAINAAVRVYGQEAVFLMRLDAHAGYPKDYYKSLVQEADATHADSVVVRMLTVGRGGFQSAVAAAQNSKLGNGGAAHRHATGSGMWVDHGHHALMRTEAFKAVQGYDETFSHNEDAELDIRLRQAGFRIWLTDKTCLEYYPRASSWRLFKQYISYGRGRIRSILKHRTYPKLRQVAPATVLPAIILALASPISLLALLPFLAWVILCLGYGVLLGLRARRAAIMLSGIAAMIMHFGWSIGFWQGIFSTIRIRLRDGSDAAKD
jgi:succinoglycan biosynthesis protein ExoA